VLFQNDSMEPASGPQAGVEPTWAAVHFRRVRRVARGLVRSAAVLAVLAGLFGVFRELAGEGRFLAMVGSHGVIAAGLALALAEREAFRPSRSPGRGRYRRWRSLAAGLAGLAAAAGVITIAFPIASAGTAMLRTQSEGALIAIIGVVLCGWRSKRQLRWFQAAAVFAALGAWLLLFVAAYSPGGSDGQGRVSGVILLLAAGAISLRPFEGLMRMAVAAHLAGRIFRRMMPLLVVLPFLIALFRLAVERHLPVEPAWVLGGVTLLMMAGTFWVSLGNALALDAVDRQRRRLERSAERHLRSAEVALDQAHTFFEGAPVCMLVVGVDGRIKSLNRCAEQVFGWRRSELVGRMLASLAAAGAEPVWQEWTARLAGSAVSAPESEAVELLCRRQDGSHFFAEAGGRVSLRTGEPLVVVHLRDISPRKNFELRLAQREQRLREAQRLGRLGYWDWDANTDTVTWSEGLCRIMEHPLDRPAPKLFEQLNAYRSDSRAFMEYALRQALSEGVPYRLELTLKLPGGIVREVLATGEPQIGAEGKVIGLFGALQDITETKSVRRELEAASERLQLATLAARIGVWDWDIANDRLQWDDRALQIFGLRREDFVPVSRQWRELIHPDDSNRFQTELHSALGSPGGFHSVFRIRRTDGVVRHLQCDGIVQCDATGRLTRMLGTHLDITESREAAERLRHSERALRESEERFRSAFETAGIGMALISPDGRWLRGNRTLATMLGTVENELLGRAVRDVTHPDDIAQDEALSRAVLDGNLRTFQRSKRFFGAQGRVIWTLVTMALVRDSEGQPLHFVGLFEDITQRRETERRVRTLNDQLRGILQFTPSLVMLFDRDGRYLIASRSLELALGKPAVEIVGKRIEDVLPAAAAEEFRQRLDRLAVSQGPYTVEEVRGDGAGEHTYLSTLFPLLDPEGRHIASGVVATDITDQRQARQVAEDALREKDILLQEIHHRVKNNLQIISSLLQMEARSVSDPVARKRFEECQGRVQAMALIHERLYRMGDLSRIDLHAYFESLSGQIIRSFGRVPGSVLAEVEVSVGPVGIETAVPCGLIVAELVTNAMKHAFPGAQRGRLEIRLRPWEQHWELLVSDNGVGPTEAGETKPDSLGLKLIHALARQLRGEVVVESSGGMEVKVRFPAPIVPERDHEGHTGEDTGR